MILHALQTFDLIVQKFEHTDLQDLLKLVIKTFKPISQSTKVIGTIHPTLMSSFPMIHALLFCLEPSDLAVL